VKLTTPSPIAVPYICLIVCCTAIKLLHDDAVAWLAGSFARSAWYKRSRNFPLLSEKFHCFRVEFFEKLHTSLYAESWGEDRETTPVNALSYGLVARSIHSMGFVPNLIAIVGAKA